MLEYIEQNLIPFAVSVVSVLLLLQQVKRVVAKRLNVPGEVWYFVAWGLGFASALLSPLDCEAWRCWVNAGLIHGAIACDQIAPQAVPYSMPLASSGAAYSGPDSFIAASIAVPGSIQLTVFSRRSERSSGLLAISQEAGTAGGGSCGGGAVRRCSS